MVVNTILHDIFTGVLIVDPKWPFPFSVFYGVLKQSVIQIALSSIDIKIFSVYLFI